MNRPDPRYAAYPDHPLTNVPLEVLDAARKVMFDAAIWKDVAPGMADPLADAVVIALLPWLNTGTQP